MLLFYLVCARAFASAGGDEVHAHDRTHDASAFTVTFEHTHVTSRDDDPSQTHVHSQTGAALAEVVAPALPTLTAERTGELALPSTRDPTRDPVFTHFRPPRA